MSAARSPVTAAPAASPAALAAAPAGPAAAPAAPTSPPLGAEPCVVSPERARARRLTALLLGGGALVLALALAADPATSGLFPECPFRAATGGLHCPGCGTLRALHQLGQGHLGAAFALNPLAVVALPLVLFGLVLALGPRPRLRAPTARPWSARLGWLVLALVLVYWIGRNVVGTAA